MSPSMVLKLLQQATVEYTKMERRLARKRDILCCVVGAVDIGPLHTNIWVVLLTTSAMNISKSNINDGILARQRCIAEIAEMIHVAILLRDYLLDNGERMRSIGSLDFVMGNKVTLF